MRDVIGRVVNVPLIVNPLNWLTVFLMVTVALFAVDAIVSARSGVSGGNVTTTL